MTRFTKVTILLLGVLLAAALIIASVAVSAQSDTPACEGEYLESVRELGVSYIEALNQSDLASWYALLADDYESRYSMVGFAALDKDGTQALAEGLFVTFPGFQTEINMSIVSTDCRYVTYYWTSTGAFDGPFGEVPPNGNPVEVSGINLVEVADGQIVHEWGSFDMSTLLTQMGLMGSTAES
jgi:steroid delta-isomerase-like uncharacterized protein